MKMYSLLVTNRKPRAQSVVDGFSAGLSERAKTKNEREDYRSVSKEYPINASIHRLLQSIIIRRINFSADVQASEMNL